MEMIMVVGASGFLGRSVAQVLTQHHKDVICLFNQNNIAIDWVWRRYSFPEMELVTVPGWARAGIVIFCAQVASAASSIDDELRDKEFEHHFLRMAKQVGNKRLIFISSDAVFDGSQGLYTEFDQPNPLTAYGKRLLLAEQIIAEHCEDHLIIRMSYLFGYSIGLLDKRWSVLRTKLLSGQTARFSRNVFKSPVNVNKAANYIVSYAQSNLRGIIHIPGLRTSVYDFYAAGIDQLGIGTYRNLLQVADAPYRIDTSLVSRRKHESSSREC